MYTHTHSRASHTGFSMCGYVCVNTVCVRECASIGNILLRKKKAKGGNENESVADKKEKFSRKSFEKELAVVEEEEKL